MTEATVLRAAFDAHHLERPTSAQRQLIGQAAATATSGLVQPVDDRLMIAGDWHGNWPAARRAIEMTATAHLNVLVHLGDFGMWPGVDGSVFLSSLDRRCADLGVRVLWLDGNHDCQDLANSYPLTPSGTRLVREHIEYLPRGLRWTWADPAGDPATWCAAGGAVSVDRCARTPGVSWWPTESLSEAEATAIGAAGPVDVLLTHDWPVQVALAAGQSPGSWHAWGVRQGWALSDLEASDAHAARVGELVEKVKPTRLFHGHLHRRHTLSIESEWGAWIAQGLAADGDGSANRLRVDTAGRAL